VCGTDLAGHDPAPDEKRQKTALAQPNQSFLGILARQHDSTTKLADTNKFVDCRGNVGCRRELIDRGAG
jgi:hypothetical protein